MPLLSKLSFAPSTSVIYITVGALLDAWTAVYYFTYRGTGTPDQQKTASFWLAGFFLTGLIFMIIGFTLGPIGRAARQAELPPPEVTPQVAQAEVAQAAQPVPVAPAAVQPAAPAVAAVPVPRAPRST